MSYITGLFPNVLGKLLMKYYSFDDKQKLARLKKKRTGKRLRRVLIREYHLQQRAAYFSEKRKINSRIATGAIMPIVAPCVFDLVENSNEMLAFFGEVKCCILERIPIRIIMKDISELSVSSLLYLIALMQDARAKEITFHVEGDLPQKELCKNIVQASGFFQYVRSENPTLQVTDHTVLRITSSGKHNPAHIKSLCDFIMGKFQCNRKETRYIYNAITELVQNTIGHAYPNKSCRDKWFFFARYNDEQHFIDIAFLDTGVGIPTTVRKNLLEKIAEIINQRDSDLILSALKGDFRTRTKLRTRGKGLPSIYQQYLNGSFKNFSLLSNNGYILDGETRVLNQAFSGTLFSWRIQK